MLKRAICAIACAAVIAAGMPRYSAALELTPELKQVVDAARSEGKLVIESPPAFMGGGDGVKAAADWMKRQFDLSIAVAWTPNPSTRVVIAKVYTELGAGQKASTDAYMASAEQIQPMLDKGVFRQVSWPQLMPGRITPEIVESDGRALRIVTRLPGILYNKQVLPQVADIHSMYDLLTPEFSGKFATTPFLAAFDGFVEHEGYEKSVDYVKKLGTQISGLVECGSGERIASGEVPALALDCAGTEQYQDRFKNVLGLRIVPDAALRRYQYLTIPVNAPDPDVAILFGLYLSSEEGQAANRARRDGDLDSYPDSSQRQMVADIESHGNPFTNITLEWTAQHKEVADQLRSLIKIIESGRK
ncbi:MAG TPA: extracellular solute-binding protein [Stellaceae bacterium]|nr:extracellular solute-binding protein [Stellaceae bacterium]